MSLISLMHELEGIDPWIIEVAGSLPPRLRHDIQLTMRIGRYPFAVVEAVAAQVLSIGAGGHTDFNAVIHDLKQLNEAECHAMIISVLHRLANNHDIPLDHSPQAMLDDQELLEHFYQQAAMPIDLHEVIELVQQPSEWRDILVSTMQRFWERVYQHQYATQQIHRERNVQYHRTHQYSPHFPDAFAKITGRHLPDHIRERLNEVSRVRFVPSHYIGPYLSFLFDQPLLTVFYNSSATPTGDNEQAEHVQQLYQPLAALADKTRLQIMTLLHGRELYAQEIVNLLDIHQSAVSRHLKLMETSGVLTVRRDKGAKFYSINRQRIEDITASLREFL